MDIASRMVAVKMKLNMSEMSELNMFPYFTRNDFKYMRCLNFKHTHTIALSHSCFIIFSYLFNFVFCKSCSIMFFAINSATFYIHIMNIIQLSTKKQMRRIATRWIITAGAIVENMNSFWDWAVMNFIRDSMRKESRMFSFFIIAHYSIAIRQFISKPYPACWCFFNKFPKSFFYWEFYGTCFFKWY